MELQPIPVLIVGAGPTGLTLANLLARLDVPFLLIDKKAHPSRESKAFAVQARTLEIFDELGIAQSALAAGSTEQQLHFLVNGKLRARFVLKNMLPGETPFPYLLILAQNKTELLLQEALHKQGQQVHWQHELHSFTPQPDGQIQVQLKTPAGELRHLRVQYLLGCDGAGSTVRKQGGFSFKGRTYSPTFYLADGRLNWHLPAEGIFFSLAADHFSAFFPLGGAYEYRVFNLLNKGYRKSEAEFTQQDMQHLLDANPHLQVKLQEADWLSVFQIHARQTGEFSRGPLFLAGDAAHVHSPVGGQGMNTGIQDAYNLAWKLCFVLKGLAAPQLLQTYHQERHPIAKNLLNTTYRFFQLLVRQGPFMNFFRLRLLPAALQVVAKSAWLRQRGFRRVSQIGIRYKNSRLNRQDNASSFTAKAPRPGDRAPYVQVQYQEKRQSLFQLLRCTRFTVLVATAYPASAEVAALIKYVSDEVPALAQVVVLEPHEQNNAFYQVYGIRQQALFIIRPDGHICYRTSTVQAAKVKAYFEETIQQQPR